MFIVLFTSIFAFFYSTMIATMNIAIVQHKKELSIVGDKINEAYAKDEIHTPFRGSITATQPYYVKKEAITKVLLRTCTHLYTKVKQNNCGDERDPNIVWSFVGTVGEKGPLDDAWSGTTAKTFSCATIDQFGRELIQEAIPSTFVVNKGYRYDFTGMENWEEEGRTDPCGYTEIIDID